MKSPDRMYELLPVVYRQRDAEQGFPLKALLRVIAEQVDVVEGDIEQLYENWFIETCEDWVVPYLGDLVGYRPVHDAGEPGDPQQPAGRALNKILIPRRDVANTIRDRRRRGTLALLELLAQDVAAWPARAVEFYRRLAWFQHLDHPHLIRARSVDLHKVGPLSQLDGPFDSFAHTVDVRRVNSQQTQGRYNIPSAGLFVWRLRAYSVTQCPACCEDARPDCYTFSVLGNDAPLFNRPRPETEPTQIAGELNLPTAIRRRQFEEHLADYYGPDRSLQVWVGSPRRPYGPDKIISANLSGWHYKVPSGCVAVDPVRGRLAFASGEAPNDQVVSVSYYYAFSADMGGGEYPRTLSQPLEHTRYAVGENGTYQTITDALNQWHQDQAGSKAAALQNAVIEIIDSGLYEERISVKLSARQTLQIRAAVGRRPVVSLSDTRARFDAMFISGAQGSRVTLDGLLIVGRGVKISGLGTTPKAREAGHADSREDLCEVIVRHCTLVPGWTLDCECEPCKGEEPSLYLKNTTARIKVEHSIIGSIEVEVDSALTEPLELWVSDSIWDATSNDRAALSGPGDSLAYARLTVARSTVFGEIQTHEIGLAENSIFNSAVCVARRQAGCMRFCYVTAESRTPRRFECQPDLVRRAVTEKFREAAGSISTAQRDAELAREELRVRPRFNSTRYGKPTYAQLAASCAGEIARGADDESEMGAFHDLFQPQRAANLRARLEEYTPAGMDAGLIYVT